MTTESLKQSYLIDHESGDFIAHACEWCAVDFAKEHGLTWDNAVTHNYTEEHENGYHAHDMLWDSGETDYPVACECGQYLDVALTKDGVQYMLENDFPAWLYEAHGVER